MLARSLFACGSAAVFDADVARQYFAEAIGLARALGDRWRLSQIRGRQAHAAFVAGDPIAARAIAEEGRELADAIGDRFESRQCRFRLAGAPCFEGDLVVAIAPFRELLAEAEANHDVMFRVTLLTLGHAEAYYGDTAAAATRPSRPPRSSAISTLAPQTQLWLSQPWRRVTLHWHRMRLTLPGRASVPPVRAPRR